MNQSLYKMLTVIFLVVVSTPTIAEPVGKQSSIPPMPEGFSSFGAAVCDGYVYVYGGHVGRTHHYSTEAVHGKFRRLNLANPSSGWEELTPGPRLQGLALVPYKGKVYRIGGMQPMNKEGDPRDTISQKSVSVYDPQTKKWHKLPDMPQGRSSHDATVVGDRIVVVGGWTMNGKGQKSVWLDNALVLDLSKKQPKWESIPQPFQKRALNLTVLDKQAVVVGGMGSKGISDREIYFLDPEKRTWKKGPRVPGLARNVFSPAACNLKGSVYISPLDGLVYRLNDSRDGWQEVGEVATKRLVHRLLPNSNSLLVIGGASRQGNVASVEVISPEEDKSN